MQIHVCLPGLIPEDDVGVSLIANSACPGLVYDTETNWYETGYVHTIKFSYLPKPGQLTQFASWEWYANAWIMAKSYVEEYFVAPASSVPALVWEFCEWVLT